MIKNRDLGTPFRKIFCVSSPIGSVPQPSEIPVYFLTRRETGVRATYMSLEDRLG